MRRRMIGLMVNRGPGAANWRHTLPFNPVEEYTVNPWHNNENNQCQWICTESRVKWEVVVASEEEE